MDKSSLQLRLANLLGISIDDDENYVSDILESLIDIGDSPDDVVEYLSSFVGNETEDVRLLSLDVQKFKLGDTVSTVIGKDVQNMIFPATAMDWDDTKRKILDEAAAQRQAIKTNAREKQQKEKIMTDRKKKEVEEEQRRLWEEAVAARDDLSKPKHSSGKQNDQKASSTASSEFTQKPAKAVPDQTTRFIGAEKMEEKSGQKTASQRQVKPRKGTPKNKPCGCFGNMHKALKNCLHCGRISCELEGINDYCHFCGYFIEEKNLDHDDANMEPAMRHKERLLEFDRTSASRTHILDDQEDYFVAATSVWSTEQERGEYHAREEERQKKVHERQRNVISFK